MGRNCGIARSGAEGLIFQLGWDNVEQEDGMAKSLNELLDEAAIKELQAG